MHLKVLITLFQKFFKQFKNHNSGREHVNQTNDPIFSFTFSDLTVTFVSEFENTQSSFSCGAPFGPFWSVKYLSFWPKATNSDSSSHFSRHLRLLKIYIMFCPPTGAKYPFFLSSNSWTISHVIFFRYLGNELQVDQISHGSS